MENFSDFESKSERIRAEKFGKIKKECDARKKSQVKILYLAGQYNMQTEYIRPLNEAEKSIIKSNLVDFTENDKVSEYYTSGKMQSDFESSIDQLHSLSNGFHKTKKGSPKKFVVDNKHILPPEFRDALIQRNTDDFNSLTKEDVSAFVYGNIMVKEDIEDLIKEIIQSGSINKEEAEKLQNLMSKRIRWNQSLNEFVYLMNRLLNKDYIEFPKKITTKSKVELLRAHFYVEGNLGKESEKGSMINAFNASSKGKLLNDKKDRLIDALR
jgi:hypothetical protein